MIKVLHLTYSNSGGAGRFAQQLHSAQLDAGMRAEFISYNTGGLAASKFEHPILTTQAAIDFSFVRSDRQKTLFSLFRDEVELFKFRDKVDPNTLLHLHWTPGVINRKTISAILSTHKVIWTLHDMFPLTGGCHHSQNCIEFKRACVECPQVRGMFQAKIEKNHAELRQLSDSFENLTLVSPSQWLQKMAQESSITSGCKTFWIPNPIDPQIFNISEVNLQLRTKIQDSEFVIGLCASDLSDPNKNIGAAIASINAVARRQPLQNFRVVAIGRNLQKYILEDNVAIEEVGSLGSDYELARAYKSMDIFINPSLQENYPTTLLESLAVGTPCIAWQSGGTHEMIANGKNGYLVASVRDLVDAIERATDDENLMRLRQGVVSRRSKIIDLKKCVELYNEVYRYSFDS